MAKSDKRTRLWSCVIYVNPEDVFAQFRPRGLKYAYIKHNGEPVSEQLANSENPVTNELTGDTKRDHWHVLVHFRNPVRLHSLQILFENAAPEGENIFAQPCSSCSGMLRYFTHEGTDKKKYKTTDIVYSDVDYWRDYQFCDDDNKMQMLQLLADIHNRLPYRKMILYYGRDYVLHREAYEEMSRLLFQQEVVECTPDSLDYTEFPDPVQDGLLDEEKPVVQERLFPNVKLDADVGKPKLSDDYLARKLGQNVVVDMDLVRKLQH